MKQLSEVMNDQFWNLSFKTGLYDFVVMSSYDHSLKSIAEAANISKKCNILDIGCGSGRLLVHIADTLKQTGSHWTGLELTPGGISACKHRIKNMRLKDYTRVLPADMCLPLPIKKESIDIAIAHFSLYVIPEREKRITAIGNIAKTLKSDGRIYVAIPGNNYNARDQVDSSLALDRNNPDLSTFGKLRNKFMYSTVGRISEIVIGNKIDKGIWKGFSEDDIAQESTEAGLKLHWTKGTYGNTSIMAAIGK
jgi:ubiquinone/menaquinone biosynthesis C-methylase UbiE